MLQVAPGFARLLATENIGVAVDVTAPTAMFDVKRRILTMPNWDCSERLRDMLVGHECAHAIFTDATDMEVLLKDVFGSVNMVAKDYLNVVEDIRIDKLIQRKYAGLRRDYRAGYAEMRDRDFFNLEDRDPNTLKFIDRLNLHFKGFDGDIQFDADEMVFVNRAENLETFEEVCDLAREIYDWCMENEGSEEVPEQGQNAGAGDDTDAPGNMPIEVPDAVDNEDIDGPSGMGGGMPSDDTGEQEGDESGKGSGDGVETKGEGTMESAADAEDDGSTAESTTGSGSDAGDEGDENGNTDPTDSEETSKGFTKTHAPAPASTQRAMDENVAGEAKIEENDAWYGGPACYDLPAMKDINLDNIIIGHKDVIAAGEGLTGNPAKWEEFQKGAKATVTNLAQMFERKKAAAVNARTQVAKTGRLDMTALHKYKMTEDIFLRNKVEIKGKNHGIVVYVDWSGSMDDCMAETVAQTAITAMFCKKVGIPFRVYAFSTHTKGDRYENTTPCFGDSVCTDYYGREDGDRRLCLSNFSLIELFSDKMKKSDWDRMGEFLMCIGDYNNHYNYPGMLHLGGTPLNESIVAAMKVASEFRKANGVDVLNSIWITDGGDGDPFRGRKGTVQQRETGRVWSWDTEQETAYGTDMLFRIYKDLAGGNLIGIFLDSKKSIERNLYYGETKNVEKILENFKKNGFIEKEHKGYDTYFLMDKKIAVYTSSDKMDALPEDASTTRVINAFRKDLGKRTMSRPLLNTFTDKIAKEIV